MMLILPICWHILTEALVQERLIYTLWMKGTLLWQFQERNNIANDHGGLERRFPRPISAGYIRIRQVYEEISRRAALGMHSLSSIGTCGKYSRTIRLSFVYHIYIPRIVNRRASRRVTSRVQFSALNQKRGGVGGRGELKPLSPNLCMYVYIIYISPSLTPFFLFLSFIFSI